MVIETGEITLRDLTFNCIIGTLPQERLQEQPIVLNVSLWLDFVPAATTENLNHSIDYAQLAEDLKGFIRRSSFKLVETLVVETGKFILKNFPKALKVKVSVSKPLAIPNCAGAQASVTIHP